MKHTSYIEISESAIKNNITFIKELLGEDVVFSSVVKGNAYGHGIEQYSKMAYKYGVTHFSVSDAHEAYKLKTTLPYENVSIVIMGMIENNQLEWAIQNNIEFYVFEKDRLQFAVETAKKIGIKAQIHIEIETGMNRTGFETKNIRTILEYVNKNKMHLNVKGVCSHLAGAESIANYKRVTDQTIKFKRIINKVNSYDFLNPMFHLASSSGTIRYPKTRLNLVRIGILQFGFFPTKEILVHYLTKNKQVENPLQRVISWKTKVMDVKTVKSGQFIGYGTSYFTNRETKIALIPIGYSSGYNRALSNTGKVLIKGKRLDVIGTVNMNMMAVDITFADAIEKGDEVVLIGSQGDQEITVSSFNDYIQVINYELLTKLPENLPRVITT
ncbi:alanine racemase [Tenacibaculum adriaticum]|uniref:Alanine racemase n=1 Tax=Tenacibaculum adriaticum TaxID=413713 RepID=A0A5S5DTY1_9FLAO|nr:alanine racemase [Tenacibaculum adriaticum]TYP99124.1 alanine racemase [Tenacibaculum adriaticum]